MPSPFPGMNPYFEQTDHLLDFHTEFLTTLRRNLAPQVGPKHIVQLEERIYIHDLPPVPRRRLGTADLSDVEKAPYLEVRDRQGRELVTVIELLSPSNKRTGDGRETYLARRREILRSPAHLVAIDLVRGWTPMPQEGQPACDYSIMVSRAEKRWAAGFWPVRLRNRLPVIPIPLRYPEFAARSTFRTCCKAPTTAPATNTSSTTANPNRASRRTDATWARQFVPDGV